RHLGGLHECGSAATRSGGRRCAHRYECEPRLSRARPARPRRPPPASAPGPAPTAAADRPLILIAPPRQKAPPLPSPNPPPRPKGHHWPGVHEIQRRYDTAHRGAAPSQRGVACMAVNGADTGFVLLSAALVLVMTPGLAFFYGGLVHRRSVVTIMMQSFISM